MKFENVSELLNLCKQHNLEVWEVMLRQEEYLTERKRDEIFLDMEEKVEIMENSIKRGYDGVQSYSGLSGGDAKKMKDYLDSGKGLSGSFALEAIAAALSVNEVNAAMGVICATPTAGSAGVVPALLSACSHKLDLGKDAKVKFLLTSGAFGLCIANQAPIAGASGGCQAEVGSASGMAAAAMTYVAGGSPEQSAHALAMALKNILGLVCDPVAGLVEIPCIKRNAMGVSNAIAAAEMALAGIKSKIPADEVIQTMGRIGQLMPAALRETALGGLAVTPTAKAYVNALEDRKQETLTEEITPEN